MKTYRVLGAAFALLLILAFAAVPAFAQGAGSTCLSSEGNGNFVGANNWQTLCGQPAVFAFDYDGNNDPVTIEMATNPQNAANFFVYTPAQFQMGVNMTNPQNGGGNSDNPQNVSTLGTPIGAGTQQVTGGPNDDGSRNFIDNGNLIWNGASPEHGTFYVLVQPKSQQATPFWINATGSGQSGFRFVPSAAATGTMAMTTTGAKPATTGTTATTGTAMTTQARPGTAGGPPVTLPRTGGEFEAMQLLAAGAALVSAGLFLRRRK